MNQTAEIYKIGTDLDTIVVVDWPHVSMLTISGGEHIDGYLEGVIDTLEVLGIRHLTHCIKDCNWMEEIFTKRDSDTVFQFIREGGVARLLRAIDTPEAVDLEARAFLKLEK